MCVHVREAKVNLRHCFLGMTTSSCFKAGSLVCLVMKPKDFSISTSPVLRLEVCVAALGFLCEFWGSTSGLHAYGVSTLCTELVLWPSSFLSNLFTCVDTEKSLQ